jgi:hypothetical protein
MRENQSKIKLVVMYGAGQRGSWLQIASCPLVYDGAVKDGSIVFVFAPHPNTRGRINADWIELGEKARRLT